MEAPPQLLLHSNAWMFSVVTFQDSLPSVHSFFLHSSIGGLGGLCVFSQCLPDQILPYFIQISAESFGSNLTWKLFLAAILKYKLDLIGRDHDDWLFHVIWMPCSSPDMPHLCCYFSQPILLVFFSLKKEISLDVSVSMAARNNWWSSSVIICVRSFVTWHGECFKELVSLPSLQGSCFLLTASLLSQQPPTCRVTLVTVVPNN